MDENAAMFFFNELLNSSSSSEDEHRRGAMNPQPRIQNYVESVVDTFTEEEFRRHFRMNRPTFQHIEQVIKEKISSHILDSGRHTISSREQILVTLWYFGTPDSYRSICCRFNIGRATAIRSVRRVTNALIEVANNFIVWPSGNYLDEIEASFRNIGFPNTIGCIDGSHIEIPKPKSHGQSYINRNKYASIILQGVCDHEIKFTHCYAGEVGSNHDSTVLKRSEVYEFMENQANTKFPNDTHIIGDKAYPCLPELMTSFKDNGHLTNAQRHFYNKLSLARSIIERAFGLLKKRFRCLKSLFDVTQLEWAPKYILACCVLHNICIMQNDIMDIEIPNEYHGDNKIDDNEDDEQGINQTRRERERRR